MSLSPGTLFIYILPVPAINAAGLLIVLFGMKFATDTLLISPAAMGLIFSVSRLWDCVSDPLIGHLSDRTTLAFGRRRTWMLASAVPVAAAVTAAFSPPYGLSNAGLVGWEAAAIIGYYCFGAFFEVPHTALGAELTRGLPVAERTRMFGLRHVGGIIGQAGGVILLYFLLEAQDGAPDKGRSLSAWVGHGVGAAFVVTTAVAVARIVEPPARQISAASAAAAGLDIVSSIRGVLASPHARLLSLAFFIEESAKAVFNLSVTCARHATPRRATPRRATPRRAAPRRHTATPPHHATPPGHRRITPLPLPRRSKPRRASLTASPAFGTPSDLATATPHHRCVLHTHKHTSAQARKHANTQTRKQRAPNASPRAAARRLPRVRGAAASERRIPRDPLFDGRRAVRGAALAGGRAVARQEARVAARDGWRRRVARARRGDAAVPAVTPSVQLGAGAAVLRLPDRRDLALRRRRQPRADGAACACTAAPTHHPRRP